MVTPHDLIALRAFVVLVTCTVLAYNSNGVLEVLITKRAGHKKEDPGKWSIVGGKVDPDDWGDPDPSIERPTFTGVLERTIRREAEEEVGITDLGALYTYRDCEVVYIREYDGMPAIVFRFWALLDEKPAITLGEENIDYRFVSLDDLRSYNFLGNVQKSIESAIHEADTAVMRNLLLDDRSLERNF